MSYVYSQINRLKEPHSYMYTPFRGDALLQSYQSSRMLVLRRLATAGNGKADQDNILVTQAVSLLNNQFDTSLPESGRAFRILVQGSKMPREERVDGSYLNGIAIELEIMTTFEPVKSLDLLRALIAVQLVNLDVLPIKVWLDRLVQRFEVTKKIYESYPPGFRKGEGSNTSVRLYWLFALALCLFYARTKKIKYLSTLLKLGDLLCSLPENEVQENIPEFGLQVVLAVEIASVQLLAQKKGVLVASK